MVFVKIAGKFVTEIRVCMTVDVDHDLIGIALVALPPEGTVCNAAADAFRHKNHPRYQFARTGGVLCLPYFCPCILRWVM